MQDLYDSSNDLFISIKTNLIRIVLLSDHYYFLYKKP